MASNLSWSCTLSVDDNDDIQTVTAQATATLPVSCPGGASLNWNIQLKIGIVYYDSGNNALDANGNPLPGGQEYSYYEVVTSASKSGSPSTATATATNHNAATVCQAHKPAGAVTAGYWYYAAASGYSSCPAGNFSNVVGPKSPSAGFVTL